MRFIRTLLFAILLDLLGAATQYLHHSGLLEQLTEGRLPPAVGRFAYGGAVLLGLLTLFFSALRARRRGERNFDMIVAAESLIAFGILSLLLGLGLAVLVLATGIGDLDRALAGGSLEPLLLPVAEGLLATALATILANLLRQLEMLRYGAEPAEPRPAETADQAGLPLPIEQRLAQLGSRLDQTAEQLDRLALTFRQGVTDYGAALERLRAATDGLGSEVARSGDSIRSFSSEITAAGTAGSEAVRELAAESRRFKDAAREGTTLLDGLARLIASVERFVRPDRQRP